MKRNLLRISCAVAAFVCAVAGIVALYWLYASRSIHPWDPLIVMPVASLASGALVGLGVGVLLRKPLLWAAVGAVCLWPIIVIGVLLFLPAK
jgi:hypothetical protein